MGTHQGVSEAGEGMRGFEGVMGRLAVQQCWRVVMGAKRLASVVSVVVLCDVALCVGWERVRVL